MPKVRRSAAAKYETDVMRLCDRVRAPKRRNLPLKRGVPADKALILFAMVRRVLPSEADEEQINRVLVTAPSMKAAVKQLCVLVKAPPAEPGYEMAALQRACGMKLK